jgi:N-acetylneuraminic acid mutarotase
MHRNALLSTVLLTLLGVAGTHCAVSTEPGFTIDAAKGKGATLPDVNVTAQVEYDNYFERFDPASGTFVSLDPPPTKRSFAAAAAGGRIVLVGGLDESTSYASDVDIYDPATAMWSKGAPWTRAHDAYTVAIGDLVCMLAGSTGVELHPVRTLDCYDVTTNTWSARKDLPATQNNEGAIVVTGGKLYMLDFAHIGPSLDVIEGSGGVVYDPSADTWTVLPKPPAPRANAAWIAAGDQLFQVGGIDVGGLFDQTKPGSVGMEIFDVKSATWTAGPQMPSGRLAGFGVDYVGDRLVAYLGLGVRNNADTYKPGDVTWHAGQNQPASFDPGVYTTAVHDGRLYLLDIADNITGGGTTASGKLWRYEPTADTWSLAGTRAPDARNAFAAGLSVGDNLYFAGTFSNVKITSKK